MVKCSFEKCPRSTSILSSDFRSSYCKKKLFGMPAALIISSSFVLLFVGISAMNSSSRRLASMVQRPHNLSNIIPYESSLLSTLNISLLTNVTIDGSKISPQKIQTSDIDVSDVDKLEAEVERLIHQPKSEEITQKLVKLEDMIEAEIIRLNFSYNSPVRYASWGSKAKGKSSMHLLRLKQLLRFLPFELAQTWRIVTLKGSSILWHGKSFFLK